MDDYVNVGRWFSILHRRSQLFVVEACQKLNLTFSEYIMLIRIFDNEGAKQDELASMLYLDKAVVTRVIKTLEEKGFVYREQDARDRRMKRVYITAYGKSQEEFIKNIIKRLVTYMEAQMPPDEVQSLMRGFQDLADKMSKTDLHQI